jgi:hypothetical protein
VAKLADAYASGAYDRKVMEVRFLSAAPKIAGLNIQAQKKTAKKQDFQLRNDPDLKILFFHLQKVQT